MRDPSAAMQVALFGKLTTHAAITGFAGGAPMVYDKTPAEPVYPYIRIGEDQTLPRANACMDGWDFIATIHVYSRDAMRPRMHAKEVGDAVCQALANREDLPTPAGFVVKESELSSTRYFMDDGLTGHGVVTLEYRVRPA